LAWFLKKAKQKLVMANKKESAYDENIERESKFVCLVLTFQMIFHIWGWLRIA
jgi:hypothetical protein